MNVLKETVEIEIAADDILRLLKQDKNLLVVESLENGFVPTNFYIKPTTIDELNHIVLVLTNKGIDL